jgi:hypothetical protein
MARTGLGWRRLGLQLPVRQGRSRAATPESRADKQATFAVDLIGYRLRLDRFHHRAAKCLRLLRGRYPACGTTLDDARPVNFAHWRCPSVAGDTIAGTIQGNVGPRSPAAPPVSPADRHVAGSPVGEAETMAIAWITTST